MRTTLTLDPDLAVALKERAHQLGLTFKQVVNTTLRAGLSSEGGVKPRRYRLRPVSLGGLRPGLDLTQALRLADALEDEEIRRKLELRK
ncbi:MAG: DUF2191 domain-containing protein [Thermoanaerobaculia bacterium]